MTPRIETSKRPYLNLADYADQQGIPTAILVQAGWSFVTYQGRPAAMYSTKTGNRYRFLDGQEPRHCSPRGYKPCWYGLETALELVTDDQSLVMVNGASSVIAGQYHGLPTFAVSDGESRKIPQAMLEELKAVWQGSVLIALDCDATGQRSAAKRARQLLDAGIEARAVHLQLPQNGDIADFCKLHAEHSLERLLALPEIAPEAPLQRREIQPISVSNDDEAKKLAAAWVDKAITTLASITSGRHDALLRTALRVGALVNGGYIPYAEAQRGLMDAAKACGFVDKYSEREANRIIANGFDYAEPQVIEIAKPSVPKRAINSTHFATEINWGIGYWEQGLPNSVRAAALRFMPTGAVVILEILNAAIIAGFIRPSAFTPPELLKAAHALGYGVTKRALYKYLDALEYDSQDYDKSLFFSVIGVASLAKESSSLQLLPNLGIRDTYTTPKFGTNSKSRGRKAEVYRLNQPDTQWEAIEQYARPRMFEAYHPTQGDDPVIALFDESMANGMDQELFTEWKQLTASVVSQQPLHTQKAQQRFAKAFQAFQKSLRDRESFALPESWLIRNHNDYVRALAHAYGRATEGEHISQSQWQKWLGISENSVPDTLRRAGLMNVTPRECVYISINIHAANAKDQIYTESGRRRGYPQTWEAYDRHGNLITSYPFNPNTIDWVIHQLQSIEAAEIKLSILLSYTYKVVSDVPVEIHKPVSKGAMKEQTTYKSTSERSEPFRAPVYNPQWFAEQFRMVMDKVGLWHGGWEFYNGDGEIVEATDHLTIASIYISHLRKEPSSLPHLTDSEVLNGIIAEQLAA